MAAPRSETINQRFAQLIQKQGLNKNAFAQSLGKTASVIQHLIDGRNKPGYDLLCKVFEIYPNVSRDWLMLGQGPMYLTDSIPTKEEVRPVAEPVNSPAEATQEALDFDEPVIPAPRRPAPAPAPAAQPVHAAVSQPLAPQAEAPTPIPAPMPTPAPMPAPPIPSPAPVAAPDASLALALQTQNLQHQLALAELRNQHLLEQQQMLREMLTIAQKLT